MVVLCFNLNETLNCLNFNKKLEELGCSKIFDLKHMHSVD